MGSLPGEAGAIWYNLPYSCQIKAALMRSAAEDYWTRLRGGKSPGALKGNTNAFKHGRYSAESIEGRRKIAASLRTMRTVVRGSR
jgi:hypothetical protein